MSGEPYFPQLWANIRDATEHMLDVENALRDMRAAGENVAHYAEAVPHWWAAVVAPRIDWGATVNAPWPGIEKPYLLLLHSLASHLERGERPQVAPDEAAVSELMQVLADVEGAVQDDQRLAYSMRTRISGLVAAVRNTLEDYFRYSPEQLQHIIDELTGVLIRAAAMSQEPADRTRWRDLGLQVAVGLTTNGAWATGQAAVTTLFTGGSSLE